MKSHPEGRRYICRSHPYNEILMRLDEIFEIGKKQDLTPMSCSVELTFFDLFLIIVEN
jgi:hypothetical protein